MTIHRKANQFNSIYFSFVSSFCIVFMFRPIISMRFKNKINDKVHSRTYPISIHFSRLRLRDGHFIKFIIMPASASIAKRKLSNVRMLYPFHLMEFKAIFMYGINFERERNIFAASGSVQLTAGLIVLFVAVTAIILWLFRRKLNRPRDELQLAFMDSLTLIIGGGNLQMTHRFERWFFGTLLVGAFFMMAVFGGNLLDCFISVSDSKVRTFDDLAKTNSTIIIKNLALYDEEIIEMLR